MGMREISNNLRPRWSRIVIVLLLLLVGIYGGYRQAINTVSGIVIGVRVNHVQPEGMPYVAVDLEDDLSSLSGALQDQVISNIGSAIGVIGLLLFAIFYRDRIVGFFTMPAPEQIHSGDEFVADNDRDRFETTKAPVRGAG